MATIALPPTAHAHMPWVTRTGQGPRSGFTRPDLGSGLVEIRRRGLVLAMGTTSLSKRPRVTEADSRADDEPGGHEVIIATATATATATGASVSRCRPSRAAEGCHNRRMAKYGGSLERGRRLPHEVVAPPPAGDLSASERAVQAVLRDLVESVGGRFDRGPAIPLGDVGLLADYFERWASN